MVMCVLDLAIDPGKQACVEQRISSLALAASNDAVHQGKQSRNKDTSMYLPVDGEEY